MRAAFLALALSACTLTPQPPAGWRKTFYVPQGYTFWAYAQGASHGSDCPGQYPYYVQAPDGAWFFLECYGSKEPK